MNNSVKWATNKCLDYKRPYVGITEISMLRVKIGTPIIKLLQREFVTNKVVY